MTNPFDDPGGRFRVLVNEERQHSLWPAAMAVPVGWRAVFGPDGREDCLAYVERSWTDMRPARLTTRRD